MGGEVVEFLGFLKEATAEVGDMAGVAHVAAELFGGEFRGMEKLGFKFVVGGVRVGQVGEKAFFIVGPGDAEGIEVEALGDGGIDDEGGKDGAGGLVIEVEFSDALGFGKRGDFRGELAKNMVA